MHSFNHLESNFWWSLLSIKAYQLFLLGRLARSYFWKSTWKIYQIFIFTNLHIFWRFTSQKMQYIHETWCPLSLPKEIDAFWYPSHPSMIKIGWYKWGKGHSWSLNDLFDSNWKLKQFAVNPSACFEFIHIDSFD